jgi:hypothetical protein
VTVDTVDGRPVGPMLSGSTTGTDLTLHVLAFRPGREYVSLHTRPRSTSFSNHDIWLLSEQVAIDTMIVVGVDGIGSVMTRGIVTSATLARTVESEYLRELDRLKQAHVPIAERPHFAMEHIVARHGWLYDRVTRPRNASTPY